jgi:hypothetical protein
MAEPPVNFLPVGTGDGDSLRADMCAMVPHMVDLFQGKVNIYKIPPNKLKF